MTCMTSSHIALVTRRIVAGCALGLAALTTLATPASAAGTASRVWFGQPPSTQQRTCTLDGFAIDQLPGGLGSPSDFEYEWEDVAFHSRVWETGPDPEGATKVDLTMKTIRGEQVIDLETLREFLTEYHEKDPAEWKLTPLRIGTYGGYAADGQAFFFVSPGVAAEVSIDRARYSQEDLLTTAAGFHPEDSV